MKRSALLLALLLGGCAANGTQPPNAAAPVAATGDLATRARDELARAFQSADPVIRSQAIEATQHDLAANPPAAAARQERQRLATALSSADPQERFAAALAAGADRLRDEYPALLRLADDPNVRVQVAARYALHRLGDTRRSHDLEDYARDPDASVRGDTALVLGLIEDPSAVKPLAYLLKDASPAVRLQAAEGLWRHGDERGLNALIAATINEAADNQMIAVLALAQPRDPRLDSNIALSMGSPYDEVRLVAARALGMVGNGFGYNEAAAHVDAADARQRALAALALGAIGRPDAKPLLSKLLADPDPSVRVAAASAALQLR